MTYLEKQYPNATELFELGEIRWLSSINEAFCEMEDQIAGGGHPDEEKMKWALTLNNIELAARERLDDLTSDCCD